MNSCDEKVFVLSLHRVMTRSTDALLAMHGYDSVHLPKYFRGRNLQEEVRGYETDTAAVTDILAPLIDAYDAFSDIPIPVLYRELADRWPASKFVLVHRDPVAWVRSVRKNQKNRKLSPFNKVQYHFYMGTGFSAVSELADEDLIVLYFRHLFGVYEFFEARGELDRLCVVGIGDPEAGEKVSRFLGKPERPMPNIVGQASDLGEIRRWASICSWHAGANRLMAEVLMREGRFAEAEPYARKTIEQDPDHPGGHEILATIAAQNGRYWASWGHATAAVRAGKGKPSLYKKAALQGLLKGQFRESLRLLAGWRAVKRRRKWQRV